MALMVAVGAFRRLLVPGFAYVLVTNCCGKAEFPRTSECVGSNIRTSRVVAKIFSEQFFATVWRFEARFDRYLRNGGSTNRILIF
jgi:hypothetical protein